jgi:phenylacetate-coenzyme A ligase PaaK-like adenylate-forming protein
VGSPFFVFVMHDFEQDIFDIKHQDQFDAVAVRLFEYQLRYNEVYRDFVSSLGIDTSGISKAEDIPCMPVEFFKHHEIKTGNFTAEKLFMSSGTGNQQVSVHHVKNLRLYDESLTRTFRLFYGNPADYAIFALLPSYLERENASLVYMARQLMDHNPNRHGGFYLNHNTGLQQAIDDAVSAGFQPLLIGVSFALLDIAENGEMHLDNTIIMETGGMKGRRREIIRDEMHDILQNTLQPKAIHSEYGMTELMSQAYNTGSGLFHTPPWMRVFIRDIHDPRDYLPAGQQGLINVIDLANIHTCAFLETKDLGKCSNSGFSVSGRLDYSDIRGCNLLL